MFLVLPAGTHPASTPPRSRCCISARAVGLHVFVGAMVQDMRAMSALRAPQGAQQGSNTTT